MTSNKNTSSPVPANVDEFNQYIAPQEKILANRENALMNKEKMLEEKETTISKISSKVSHCIVAYLTCCINLFFIVWLSEVVRLVVLNKFDFRLSLNLHHVKIRKYGLFLLMLGTA